MSHAPWHGISVALFVLARIRLQDRASLSEPQSWYVVLQVVESVHGRMMMMTMQIGRMLGNLVAHNVLTDCQAEDLVVSAAPDAEAVWITCMDADDIPWHLGYAVNAGQHEPQLTMRQLAEQQVLHQVGC